MWCLRGDGEHNDESKFPSVYPFEMLIFAAIMMEGEVETEPESLERLSSWLLKLDRVRLG